MNLLLRTLPITALLAHAPLSAGTLELTLEDPDRSRQIPLRIYLPSPDAEGARPVILFSHGLGGSNRAAAYAGEAWAEAGYVSAHLQHPGSDASLWSVGAPREKIIAGLRLGANAQNLLLRIGDVSFVLDELERLHRQKEGPLAGRLDLDRVGMAGHSFGAGTSQAIAGQQYPLPGGGTRSFHDTRVKAVIFFSPSAARGALDQATSFGAIGIPTFHVTGTEDGDPLNGPGKGMTPERRLLPFEHATASERYLLVFDGAGHSVFAGSARWAPPVPERIHPAIIETSTIFWDAYLQGDTEARSRLQGEKAEASPHLAKADRWEFAEAQDQK